MGNYAAIFEEKKYITTGELAQILNINDATIRYYCIEFEDFIQPIRSNKKRYFEEEHVERLIYIVYLLKEKRLTVRLVKEHLKTENGKVMKPIDELVEKPLLPMIFQINEKLDLLAKDHNVLSNAPRTNNDQDLLVREHKLNDTGSQYESYSSAIHQVDYYICSIKNYIQQYELAKSNELLDEMVGALCSIETSAVKLKSLAFNLKK